MSVRLVLVGCSQPHLACKEPRPAEGHGNSRPIGVLAIANCGSGGCAEEIALYQAYREGDVSSSAAEAPVGLGAPPILRKHSQDQPIRSSDGIDLDATEDSNGSEVPLGFRHEGRVVGFAGF